MYYGGICNSDTCFGLSICLLALSIWQTRCVMYNMTNFGQINNFLVLVLVLACNNTHLLLYISSSIMYKWAIEPHWWSSIMYKYG